MSDRNNCPDAVGSSSESQSYDEKPQSAEGSPSSQESSENQSLGENSQSAEGSPSSQEVEEERRSRSRIRSRSRSYSFRWGGSYSRSRSHSRGRKYQHYSHSRSHSPHHRRYSRSRSHSRSYSPRYRPRHSYYDDPYNRGSKGYSGYNRFTMSSHRRDIENRDNPAPNRCLGVFGLRDYSQEQALRQMFEKFGPVESVENVFDWQTGSFRGFAFVYFEETEHAKSAKDQCNGKEIDGRQIRVDFSLPRKARIRPPPVYLGEATYSRFHGSKRYGKNRRNLISPYYIKDRYSRSRFRSYSPHKYGHY